MREKGYICTVLLVCLNLLVLNGLAYAGGFRCLKAVCAPMVLQAV